MVHLNHNITMHTEHLHSNPGHFRMSPLNCAMDTDDLGLFHKFVP